MIRDNRYGYRPHHEESLIESTRQSSPAASFREILIEFLTNYFKDNPDAPYWEGTISHLLKNLLSTNCNEMIIKNWRLEQTSRFLEQLQRDGSFKVESYTGPHGVRIWRFYRNDTVN